MSVSVFAPSALSACSARDCSQALFVSQKLPAETGRHNNSHECKTASRRLWRGWAAEAHHQPQTSFSRAVCLPPDCRVIIKYNESALTSVLRLPENDSEFVLPYSCIVFCHYGPGRGPWDPVCEG